MSNITLQVANRVGIDGKSAYEVALADGFEGTEAEWLDSLVGPPVNTINNLDSTSTESALSANMGRELKALMGVMPKVEASASGVITAINNTLTIVSVATTSGRTLNIPTTFPDGGSFGLWVNGNTPITFTATGKTIVKMSSFSGLSLDSSKKCLYSGFVWGSEVVVNVDQSM